ncbi:membrane dipeptidase [Aureispira anguillae]|uniref:Membrane dipeptidase n=1 Tax=Aureispira anguillae TaxID=2864201 RepID=A0A915YJ30_9BACT|nr:membrane dipeptidase [Aureispira anguillae]BDS14128.1 membrane dipeptidase [Aureispira anguillae]
MKLFFVITTLLLSHFLLAQDSLEQNIRVYMDMQMHPTMHVPYNFFGDGFVFFDENSPPHLTHLHQFKNVNYANYWKNNKGARIIVAGALTSEWVKSRKKARKVILKQLNYVNQFAAEHAEDFVVAKTAQEVRYHIKNSHKTIIIHSIEGGKQLINSLEDAEFWAKQGVAFITLMHLVDSEYGSAAVRPGLFTTLLNFKGAIKGKKKRGLTEKGKKAIKWLAQAGIMTDLTHMESQTRKDALAFMTQEKIPPLSTHDCFKAIKNNARSISGEEILTIYQLNGFMALPISGMEMQLVKSQPYYINKEDSLIQAGCHCPGSVDSYKFMYQALQQYIEANIGLIRGDSSISFANLSEEEKVKYAIGFQSDFNGWLNHSRPRIGKKGCYPIDSTKNYEAIELEGLAHPGLLASQWRLLDKEGVDLAPILRSSERFIQLWEYFRENKQQWK